MTRNSSSSSLHHLFCGRPFSPGAMLSALRPLLNLEIGSRKRALEIFRGALSPQRSARKDDCLSAKREFRLCSEARRCRIEKWEAPAHRAGLPGKETVCFSLRPLSPPAAGIAGCAPGPARGGIKIFKGLALGIFLLLLLPSLILAQELGERVQRLTLKNGLRLLMLERHLSPTVALYIRYRAGAADEADGKTGTAHLLEHMMFKGTRTIGTRDYLREEKILHRIEKIGTALDHEKAKGKAAAPALLARLTAQLKTLQKEQQRLTLSNEIDRLYTENGAVGLNASTGQDLTTYQVSIPANRIELWARIESDRMVNPVFREFYTERDVVMEERRQRSESDPDGKLLEGYLAAAFLAHPYRRPVLGWPSDMRYLDMAYMKMFFKNTHAPNNTVIAIVGDIQPSVVRKIVEKYFGRIPPQRISSSLITEEPRQSGERRVDVIFAAEPQMIIGYHKPPPPGFADHVFDVIESILTRGRTSRLFKALVDEKRIAENIQAANGLPGGRYPNQFVLFATPRHPHDCGELEQAIDQEIEKLKREPVSSTELEKVKNQIRADFIRGLDSNAGLAGMLSYYEALLGDFHYLIDYTGTIDRITPEDILQAARTHLTKENRTVAKLVNSY